MTQPWQREFLRASAAELNRKPPMPVWARFTLAFSLGFCGLQPTLGALVHLALNR